MYIESTLPGAAMRLVLSPAFAPAHLVLIIGLAACSDAPLPVAPEKESAKTLSSSEVVDVEGAWAWSETTVIQFPSFIGEDVFGLESEGPLMFSTCQSSGTMTLSQSGASFTGTTLQSGICTTRGGQSFDIPWPSFPVSGTIHGHSLSAVVDVNCRLNASMSLEGGSAVSMTGAGGCSVPPTGLNKSLHWKATRI
jgi:hypothetical protein